MGRVVKLGHGHGHGHVGGLAVAVALVAGCGAPAAAPQPEKRTPAVHFFVDSRPQGNPHAIAEGTDGAVRYGDPFVLVVDGLASGAHASIEARVYGMLAQADFIAHDDGSIDLSRDAPVSGTWDGVDPEALLWSMSAEPGVTPPAQLDLSVQVKVLVDGKDVVDGALARRFINQDLTQETVNSGRTVGELVVPPGDGPFPAVLVFGGSEGGTGTGEFDGEYLGSLGYAALGVGYFGAAGLPAQLSNVPLEILEEDLAFLAADPRVDPDRIAVMGGSRGGELALLLGAHFPVVKAVIADVPSGVVWPGGTDTSFTASWTLGGVALPYMPDVGAAPGVTVDHSGQQHITSRPCFEADLAAASASDLAAATTHVEDTSGPILLLASDADALWPSCTLADIAWQRLQPEHAGRFADETHCFPDAGHLIGIPGWSTTTSLETYDESVGGYLVTGGTAAGMGHADRAWDTAIRAFLEVNL